MRMAQKSLALITLAVVSLAGCTVKPPARLPVPNAAQGNPGTVIGSEMLAPGGATGPGGPAAPPALPVDTVTPELRDGPEATGRASTSPSRPHEPRRNVYLHGDRRRQEVALTFDDGPDRVFTPMILDVLKREGVRATFFMVGQRVEANPDIAQRIVAEGHDFGNHSYSHGRYDRFTPNQILDDLRRTDGILTRTLGRHTALFRPPYGEAQDKIVTAANQLGLNIILWNVDSLDWRSIPGWEIAYNVLPNTRWGSIILHHSAGGRGENLTGTAQEISLAIRTFKGQGYRFVTISEMLAPAGAAPPAPAPAPPGPAPAPPAVLAP